MRERRGGATVGTGTRLSGALAILAVVALVAVPLVRLGASAGWRPAVRAWTAPGTPMIAAHTAILAGVVTAIAVPAGAATALLLSWSEVPCRRTLRVAVVLPLVIPQFVLGYSWTQAYGRAGLSDVLVGTYWPALFGPAGVTAVLVVDMSPISFLLVAAGLATRAQPDLAAAARICGASSWTALRTVTLPLLRPVLGSAAVLIFVATLEAFAAPQILGTPAGFGTVTTRIYSDISLGSDPATFDNALALSLGLVLVAAVILLPADLLLTPRLRTRRTGQPSGALRGSRRTWRTWAATSALAAYLILAVGLPTIALVAAAVTRAIGLPPTPGNWTFDNFRALATRTTAEQLAHSVELAAIAASVLIVLSALVTVLAYQRSGRVLSTVATLTFAVPGSALAVGMLVAYGRWLDGSLTLILLAYLAKLWALALRPLTGAIDRIAPVERHAAQASGARPLAIVRTVLLPALLPTLSGAWLLVFVTALHEVTMSSLLYSTGSETLAVAVLNSQELGNIGETAALSVLLTVLVLVCALPMWGLLSLAERFRMPLAVVGSTPRIARAY